jgi:hypothetical protein
MNNMLSSFTIFLFDYMVNSISIIIIFSIHVLNIINEFNYRVFINLINFYKFLFKMHKTLFLVQNQVNKKIIKDNIISFFGKYEDQVLPDNVYSNLVNIH